MNSPPSPSPKHHLPPEAGLIPAPPDEKTVTRLMSLIALPVASRADKTRAPDNRGIMQMQTRRAISLENRGVFPGRLEPTAC